jgi:hypothetical protein
MVFRQPGRPIFGPSVDGRGPIESPHPKADEPRRTTHPVAHGQRREMMRKMLLAAFAALSLAGSMGAASAATFHHGYASGQNFPGSSDATNGGTGNLMGGGG